MKNIIKAIAASILMLAFASCDMMQPAGPEEEGPVLNNDLAFEIEVMDVTANTAKLRIKHNGTEDDTWYGLVTEDMKSDEADLILGFIEELLNGTNIVALKKSNDVIINLSDLKPEKSYKYIAFGITSDGTVYGKASSATFKTLKDQTVDDEPVNDPNSLKQTDNWQISYNKRIKEEDGSESDTFLIECEDGKRFYFTTVMKDLLDIYEITLIDYIQSELDYFPTLLQYYQLNQITYTESTIVGGPRMESGVYYGIALGIDEKGKQTGEYSAQKITIPEETATPEYEKWLGNWRISDGSRYYDLAVEAYDNNFMYVVSGWEEGSHLETDADGDGQSDGYDISNVFGTQFAFPTFYNNGNMDFQEYEITYFMASETSTEPEYVLGLLGVGDLSDGHESYNNTVIGLIGGVITSASTDGDTATLEGNQLLYEGISINYTGMGYLGYPVVDYINELWICNEPMEFPLTMSRLTSSETQQQSMPGFRFTKSLEKGRYRKIQTKPVVFQAI